MTSDKMANEKNSRVLNITLWICQLILAALFGVAGASKTFLPISELALRLVWPGDVSPVIVRFIGVSECLASLCLILPGLMRRRIQLTLWAAIGLMLLMVSALIFHISRGEMGAIPINLVLGSLAGFVAWGRSRKSVN